MSMSDGIEQPPCRSREIAWRARKGRTGISDLN